MFNFLTAILGVLVSVQLAEKNILSSKHEKSTQQQWMMHCENVECKT